MFKKIMREIAMFIFSLFLILYVLIDCFLSFLIDCFIGTKIAKLVFIAQKSIDWVIQGVGVYIIAKLEKKEMWY